MPTLNLTGSIKSRLKRKPSDASLAECEEATASTSRSTMKTPSSTVLPITKPADDSVECKGRQSHEEALNFTAQPSKAVLRSRLPDVRSSTTSLCLPKLQAHSTSTSKMHPSSASAFLNLPEDIMYYLLSHYFDFNTLLALRSTCRSLHALLPHDLLSRIRSAITASLLSSESIQLSDYRESHPRQPYSHLWDLFYAAFEWQLMERPAKDLLCYGCLETKPLSAFVERMSSRGTGLGGKLAEHRRCKDCMRRYITVGGVWWREHWVRKSETRRRKGRAERWARWVTRGERLVKVEKGHEVGVCASCGTGQYELYWGCKGCLEKEEVRRRREEWEMLGLEELIDDSEGLSRSDRVVKWLMEKGESWRGKRETRKRKKRARREGGGGRWWKRVVRGSVSWEGSWEGRVEALVEYLNGGAAKGAEDGVEEDTSQVIDSNDWKALDQVPLKKDRREARCTTCWVPACRRKTYMLGLSYEKHLPFERWCDDCQEEQNKKMARRRQNAVTMDSENEDEALQDVRLLFRL